MNHCSHVALLQTDVQLFRQWKWCCRQMRSGLFHSILCEKHCECEILLGAFAGKSRSRWCMEGKFRKHTVCSPINMKCGALCVLLSLTTVCPLHYDFSYLLTNTFLSFTRLLNGNDHARIRNFIQNSLAIERFVRNIMPAMKTFCGDKHPLNPSWYTSRLKPQSSSMEPRPSLSLLSQEIS